MTIRLAVGDELDLQKVTRRRPWRDFKLTKDHLITPEGAKLHPGSFRHIALMIELTKANRDAWNEVTHRLWKLETACRTHGIQYRHDDHQAPPVSGW